MYFDTINEFTDLDNVNASKLSGYYSWIKTCYKAPELSQIIHKNGCNYIYITLGIKYGERQKISTVILFLIKLN